MSKEPSPELLTSDEVAALLKVSVKTIRQWVYRGEIPNLKINGVVRFDRQVISEWILASSRAEMA